jgi:antitoxin CcdA
MVLAREEVEMRRQSSKSTSKRATNVSIRSDLLAAARDAGLNLSATLERALITELAEAQRNKWRHDNREAIEAYNEHVEKHGAFSDRLRGF